jgi:hypothetical protein
MIWIPFDSSRQDTTRRRVKYLCQVDIADRPGKRAWVHQALRLTVAVERDDVALVNRIWKERHYLGRSPTPPKVKRMSYLGQLHGHGHDAAVAVTVALLPSASLPMQRLQASGIHACSVIELVRCWRADDLGPKIAPDLMPFALRRIVNGGNGVRSLAEEWTDRKVGGTLEALPRVLLTYADPALGHDGGLYRGAGAVCLGRTANGKLAFAWALEPGVLDGVGVVCAS